MNREEVEGLVVSLIITVSNRQKRDKSTRFPSYDGERGHKNPGKEKFQGLAQGIAQEETVTGTREK